jgi:hypothetical protein
MVLQNLWWSWDRHFARERTTPACNKKVNIGTKVKIGESAVFT